MSKRAYIREHFGNDWKKGSKAFNKINDVTLLDILEVKDGIPVVKDKYKQYAPLYTEDIKNSLRNIT